jgi:hypothetical protein
MSNNGWLVVAGLLSTVPVLLLPIGLLGLRWFMGWRAGSKYMKFASLLVWFLFELC